ncbi:Unknown protein [Streptococcus suis 05ZYH33]|nr:Unknown protein [Streptococcus suis 05ZYH33]
MPNSAVTSAGFVADGDWKNVVVAIATFLIAAFVYT